MVELAIWIVCFLIVIWAIVKIGIPLLIIGTLAAISLRRVIAGIAGMLFILGALSNNEASPQSAIVLGLIGFMLFIYALGRESQQKSLETVKASSRSSASSIVMDFGRSDTDDLFKDAVGVVVDTGKASASILQRRLHVGYARAARLIEEMEEQGIIEPAVGAKPRRVLVSNLDEVFADRK